MTPVTHLRRAIGAMTLLAIAACTTAPPTAPPTTRSTVVPTAAPASGSSGPSGTPADAAVPVAGGCAGTQVFRGGAPDAGPATNPWAAAAPSSSGIVAYFFHEPPGLVIAHEAGVGSKVLWVARGAAAPELDISARPAESPSASPIGIVAPEASSPSGTYPSTIDVPTPGCWELDVTVGAAHGSIAILVAPAP
jgi:hypothetical protein